MEYREFNEYQTPLSKIVDDIPKEVYTELLSTIDDIEFISRLASKDMKTIEETPKTEDGKVIVDIASPHRLRDMNYFREAAIHFQTHGCYTLAAPSSHPLSEYTKFWNTEADRIKNGMFREDGEWIPGGLYWYWNYCPMERTKRRKESSKRSDRVVDFPDIFLGDYLFFHYLEQAMEVGEHGELLKTRGVGWHGPNSEPVLTQEGWKTYGDISEGDYLIDRRGFPTKVLEVYPQGQKDIYEVALHDGRVVRCGKEHLWAVYDKCKGAANKGKLYTYSTKYLMQSKLYWKNKNGDSLYKFYIPDIEPVQYSEKNLPIGPYALGLLLGDGSLTTEQIRIACCDEDSKETIPNFLESLGYGFGVSKYDDGINYSVTDSIRCPFIMHHGGINPYGKNRLKQALENLELIVNTSGKFIPNIYKKASVEQRLELLKGLMDSEGSSYGRGSIEFANSNFKLIKDAEELVRSLGMNCRLSKGRNKNKQEYRLHIRTNIPIFKLTRKLNGQRRNSRAKNTPIISIKKLGYKEESTCFLVDNDEHLYLTTDFIPTHNSYKQASFGPRKALFVQNSSTFYAAFEKEFLIKDGVLNKTWGYLDFLAQHTPFPRMRLKDTIMEKKFGYKDPKTSAEKGILSTIIGVSAKDDPDKLRGKRGDIFFEEHGVFPQIKKAWQVSLDSVEDGENVFGLMCAGGCLTKNNLVWTNDGNLVTIDKLSPENGILGFDINNQTISKEPITYWQPPTKKECLRITTNTGRFIECSTDHPILWSRGNYNRTIEAPRVNGKRRAKSFKKIDFKLAESIKIGDQLATAGEVNIFGSKTMWEPRLIGCLIGDGSYGHDKTPVLSNCEEEINKYVEDNFDCTVEKQYITKLGKVYKEIRIKGITKQLRELGIYTQTKLNKRLPTNFHSYCRESMSELIGGLFDTDGYLSGLRTISLSQASKEILLEVQIALQKFGIHGNIMYKKPNLNNIKSKNGHYELEIRDKLSILNFKKYIKLSVREKQDRLDKTAKFVLNTKERNASPFPGIKFERVISIEYLGLQEVYNLTAGKTNTYLGNGIITHNTGGTLGADFEGAEDMHYNPASYHIYGIPNIFDRFATGKTKTGFFWGAYLNRANCYDENGMPDIVKALKEILLDRYNVTKASTDPVHITQRKAERPITPQEAVMRVEGNFFPVSDLKDHLEKCRVEGNSFTDGNYVGRLIIEESKVKWEESFDLSPIRVYPIKDNKVDGALEIFVHPKKMGNKPVPNRYIAGIDPIDDDSSTTNSLPSIFIFDLFTDEIVAEYTGRPRFANDFYEICRRLLIYYDARANYENDKKGLFQYFELHKCLYLLVETPQILRDMQYVKTAGYGNKSLGTNSGKTINAWGRRLQRDWLLAPAINKNTDEDGNIIDNTLNLHKIRSLAYLEELIKWNSDGNFDRVSAMGMCMILRADKMKFLDSYKGMDNSNGSELAADDYFTLNYDKRFGIDLSRIELIGSEKSF